MEWMCLESRYGGMLQRGEKILCSAAFLLNGKAVPNKEKFWALPIRKRSEERGTIGN